MAFILSINIESCIDLDRDSYQELLKEFGPIYTKLSEKINDIRLQEKIEDEKLRLVEYAPTHEGMMESRRDRFSMEEHAELETILKALYEKDQDHFQFSV